MNKFSFYLTSLFVALATLFSSCDSDEEYASILLSHQAVFFSGLGESRTVTYTGSNVSDLEVSNVPDGWEIVINRSNLSIEVYGPKTQEEFDASLEDYTIITFTATSLDDNCGYDYMTVGTTTSVIDISSQQANCFMVSQPNTIYTFDATVKGEGQGTISPASVSLKWQTITFPITYSRLNEDGKVEFHVARDDGDVDLDEDYNDIIEGNALIAAYDADDEILWTWHIWVSDFDADASAVSLNGQTIMDRNLGANDNSTATNDKIYLSYGLYYQWGRKDPFPKPYYYNAASSTDSAMQDESGNIETITYSSSSSSKGKESYAIENPLVFLLGVEDSSYDWLFKAHYSGLWSEEKTINDPCPKGWRVASSAAFTDLKVPSLTEEAFAELKDDYGWYLSDAAGNSSLFMGFGRRSYLTGRINIINANETRPEPWSGYYWTVDSTDNYLSTAMFFTYDSAELSGNQVMLANYYRANGMQIRCQRYE